MPHYIKTGYWALEKNGYKGWLNLEDIIGGGGGSATVVTKAQVDALIASSSLVPGSTYIITGVDVPLYGGTTIILQAETTNKLALAGHGIFYNPKYLNSQLTPNNGYGIWSNYMYPTFSNIVGTFNGGDTVTADNGATAIYLGPNFLSWVSGDWSLATSIDNGSGATADITGAVSPSYSIGQDVIWGGKHWTNTSGNVGTSVDKYTLSGADWTEVAFNSTDYNVEIDIIHYDYTHDMIIRRKDRWDNDVDGNFQVFTEFASPDGYDFGNPIKDFQWGNYPDDFNTSDYEYIGVQSNYVKDSYLECINFIGENLMFNTLQSQSYFTNVITSKIGEIYKNVLNIGSSIKNIVINSCGIRENTLNGNSVISGLKGFSSSLSNNSLDLNSYIEDNIIDNTGIINNNLVYSSIIYNNLVSGSSINDNKLFNSGISSNTQLTQVAFNIINYSVIISNTTSINGGVISHNTLNDGSVIGFNNFDNGTISYNLLDRSQITSNSGTSYNIQNNVFASDAELNSNTLTSCTISRNTLNINSAINNNTFSNCFINDNEMNDGYILNNNNDGQSISLNVLSVNANIYANTNCSFNYCEILRSSEISYNTLTVFNRNTLLSSYVYYINPGVGGSATFSNNTLSESAVNLTTTGAGINGKSITNLTSNQATLNADVSAATIIYGNYSKQLFKRQDGTTRLGYYNNSDVFTVVNVNA